LSSHHPWILLVRDNAMSDLGGVSVKCCKVRNHEQFCEELSKITETVDTPFFYWFGRYLMD
jgi:hypothetical protein